MLEDWWNRERARGTVDSVHVVAVNVGEDVEIVRGFVERRKLPFRVVLDADMSAAQAFRVTALPTLVVIDRAGRIVEVEVGFTPKVGFNLNKALLKMGLGPAP
jgi:peroxiredoxin